MLQLKYINRPEPTERSLYDEAIQWMTEEAGRIDGLISFYQFGNITSPGISDLDFLFVFGNGAISQRTGFENLPDQYNTLFTHRIMAVSEAHFIRNNHYTLWSDYKLITGKETSLPGDSRSEEEIKALKIQTAIEFLAANYLDLKQQLIYKTINLRSFLQHMKGLLYDLDYLDIHSGEIYNHLMELKHVILHWFVQQPSDNVLNKWIEKFDRIYDPFCNEMFQKYPIYIPNMEQYNISRNAVLKHSNSVSLKHKGIVFPQFISSLGKKMNRLQNRFNKFELLLPLTHETPLAIIEERFNFLREMKDYNRVHLPSFMTITTSITSKII